MLSSQLSKHTCLPVRAYTPHLQTRNVLRQALRPTPSFKTCSRCRLRLQAAAAESRLSDEDEDELTDKMAEFLREQAKKESGGQIAVPEEPPTQVLGAEEISEEEAKQYCRDIMRAVKDLRENRDMSINEVKLTLAIEDPTLREKRDYLGVEDGAGVSRDEMAAALLEVTAGRIPLDRLALREVWREIKQWPFLNSEEELQAEKAAESNYEGITETGVQSKQSGGWRSGQARPPIGRDKNEQAQSLTDMLPDWMGYGFLYLVSAIPVIITVTVISILFFNSLH